MVVQIELLDAVDDWRPPNYRNKDKHASILRHSVQRNFAAPLTLSRRHDALVRPFPPDRNEQTVLQDHTHQHSSSRIKQSREQLTNNRLASLWQWITMAGRAAPGLNFANKILEKSAAFHLVINACNTKSNCLPPASVAASKQGDSMLALRHSSCFRSARKIRDGAAIPAPRTSISLSDEVAAVNLPDAQFVVT
jgi:hypothetical protein